MRRPQRRIGPVVAQEDDQRILGHAQRIEMVEQITQRLVHPLDQRCKGLGRGRLARRLVMFRKPGIGLERSMHRVLCEVEEEWPFLLHCLGDVGLRFEGERFRQKRLRPVVFFEPRYGRRRLLQNGTTEVAIVSCAKIAARLSDRRTAHVEIKPQPGRIGPSERTRREVPLANMDRAIARRRQQARKRDIPRLQPPPVPVGRTLRTGVVVVRVDPVRCPMPGRVLTGQQRNPCRRADAHRVELVEANPPGRQPLHIRRAIKVVERIALRLARLIHEKRQRRIHHPHVIDEHDDDIGPQNRFRRRDRPRKQRHKDERRPRQSPTSRATATTIPTTRPPEKGFHGTQTPRV